MADLRWPFEPLHAAAGCPPAYDLARRLGVSKSWVQACQKRGLSDKVADRWSVALGMHPAQVWPDWFDPYLDDTAVLFTRLWSELSATGEAA